MLDEERIQFSSQLAASSGAGQQGATTWAAPQLLTRYLLSECKGPDAEWLVQSGVGGSGAQGILADARGLPTVAEEAAEGSNAGSDEPVPELGVEPLACCPDADQAHPEDGSTLLTMLLEAWQAQPKEGSGDAEGSASSDGGNTGGPYALPGLAGMAAADGCQSGDESSSLSGLSSPLILAPSSPSSAGTDDGALQLAAAAATAAVDPLRTEEELLGVAAWAGAKTIAEVADEQQQEEEEEQGGEGRCLLDADSSSSLTALHHNDVFDPEASLGTLLPVTPDWRTGMAGANVTPGSDSAAGSAAGTPALGTGRCAVRCGAGLEPARSLEAQLQGATFAGAVAGDAGLAGKTPLEAAALLAQLWPRLEAAEAEVQWLREEKAAAELRAAALQDEVQLAFAALEASQQARQEALAAHAQVSSALQSAAEDQALLAREAEEGRRELAAALEKVERLEYRVELMQVERQEAGEAAQHGAGTFGLHAPGGMGSGSARGPEVDEEVAALRAALAEANRSKAVLASKLKQCRADSAVLAGRLQASQARHSADLARAAAAARDGAAAAWAEAGRLRAENQQLATQVLMLHRQLAASGESERGAALGGIIRQREEQLVQAHLEMAQLQGRVRELEHAEARCDALEARCSVLLRQHEALADKLHAAQSESAGWRGALGRLSDELAALTACEAAARAALDDTATRLLVHTQLCEAQAQELDMLRAQAARGTGAGRQPQGQQAQQREQQHQAQHLEQHEQQQFLQQYQQQAEGAVASVPPSVSGGSSEPGPVPVPPATLPPASSRGPQSVASSEEDASPSSRKSSSSKFSWLKLKSFHS